MAASNRQVEIVFNAETEMLSGTVPGHRPFNMRAFSGGGRGHTHVNATQARQFHHSEGELLKSRLANTPELKNRKGQYLQRGGTLPSGHYTCVFCPHSSVGRNVIRLDANLDAIAIYSPFSAHPIPHGTWNSKAHGYKPRAGFYIHGHGPKGSDGCIVPESVQERLRLTSAIRDYPGVVLLRVKNVGYVLPAELGGRAFA